jgi:valyl-tRNA synthetase
LTVEDRWLLSRLATVARQVTDHLAGYRYADAARVLYEFAWDEFCSFYVEMVKSRLQDESARPVAQRVLASALDTLLRLLHPMIPFLTEEVWQLLAGVAPARGIDSAEPAVESVMIAAWPESDARRRDPHIEEQFARFQEVLRAVREIRSRQNVPPKQELRFSVRCDAAVADLLRPMEPYFLSMAGARPTGFGPDIKSPPLGASTMAAGLEVFVDLAGLIDIGAEIKKKQQELGKLEGMILGKRKKLENEAFVSKAPEAVVQKERDSLKELDEQRATTLAVIERLTETSGKDQG